MSKQELDKRLEENKYEMWEVLKAIVAEGKRSAGLPQPMKETYNFYLVDRLASRVLAKIEER